MRVFIYNMSAAFSLFHKVSKPEVYSKTVHNRELGIRYMVIFHLDYINR